MNEHFVVTSVDDPRAAPLFEGLEQEYGDRYRDVIKQIGGSAREELERYPAAAFSAPHGAFLLLLRDGQAIAGGAFMAHRDAGTAEFKRIWTRHDVRRQGIASRVLAELERNAARQGYERVYLTTGFRQPEAVQLYLKHGYQALFDLDEAAERVVHLPFEKQLSNTVNLATVAGAHA